MHNPGSVVISGAVEGLVDEAVLRRLVEHVGALPGRFYGKKGKDYLRQQCQGYNRAAIYHPWVLLVDLNQDFDCAPLLRQAWLPEPAPRMCLCIAVRGIEAWLLADRERISSFLGVRIAQIPTYPEASTQPKHLVVDLARQSRRRGIRQDMAPRPQNGRVVGAAYTSRLVEFISDLESGWRPDVAARSSESLQRCLDRLRTLTVASQPL